MKNIYAGAVFCFLVILSISGQAHAAGICSPQCTDYVNKKLHLDHHVGSAVNWWSNPPNGYKRHKNGDDDKPDKGDIMVWDTVGGGNGHVAVVTAVDGNSVTVMDSNWSPNWMTDCKERTHKLSLSNSGSKKKKNLKYTINESHVIGWLSK